MYRNRARQRDELGEREQSRGTEHRERYGQRRHHHQCAGDPDDHVHWPGRSVAGGPPVALVATASSGLTVAFASNAQSSLHGCRVTLTLVGRRNPMLVSATPAGQRDVRCRAASRVTLTVRTPSDFSISKSACGQFHAGQTGAATR